MNEIAFVETELMLPLAMKLSPNSNKDIADAAGIKSSSLYKCRTTDVHLSPKKVDALIIRVRKWTL